MKFFKYIILLLVIFTSCKSSKHVTNKESALKAISAKKLIKKHVANNFDKNTIDAKLKVNFKNEKQNLDFSVKMRIKKDEVIWLKGTKFITVFKVKITPNKVSFYSPYYKNYIEGDFSMLTSILGLEVNFQQLQNMLFGQAMFDTSQKHTLQPSKEAYELSPKNQPNLFNVFYSLNSSHFKLDKQSLVNEAKQQRLDIEYPAYKTTNKVLFPERIVINGTTKNKQSNIDMLIRTIIFNSEISIPYKIPEGYKEIKL